jgi:PAS domain S-box-containing protein
MKRKAPREDPAIPAMILDILRTVLGQTAHPGEAGRYVTEELRERTGARCVLLAECSGPEAPRLVHVNPARQQKFAATPEMAGLIRLASGLPRSQILTPPEVGVAAGLLQQLGEGRALAVPLATGEFRFGVLLAFGMPEERMTAAELPMFDTMASVMALILRNTVLYERQEQIIQERTRELQAANAALQRSEAQYLDLYANAPDMFLSVDVATGGVFQCNRAVLEATGYPREEFVGRPIFEFYHTGCRERAQEAFRTFVATGEMKNVELQVVRKDGSTLTVSLNASAVRDAAGRIVASRSIWHDITERQRAAEESHRLLEMAEHSRRALLGVLEDEMRTEQALRQKTEELDRYFTTSLDLLCIADIEGHFRRLNPEWEKILGYPLAELIGRCFLDFVHPDDLAATQQSIANLAGQSQVLRFTNRYRHRDGTYRWLEWNSFPERTAIYAVARDVTERKRVEEELFESRQMLQMVLDNIPQRVFWKNRDLVYVGCNRPLAQDCGYTDPAELVGKTDFETASAATAEMYRADDQRVIESGQAKLNFEEKQIKADGSVGWLRTSKIPLHDATGQAIGVLGTYEDITERRRADEALRESERRLSTLVGNLPGMAYRCENDRHWTMRFISEGCQALTGYAPEDLVGNSKLSFNDLIVAEDQIPAWAAVQSAVQARRPYELNYRIRHASGEIRWMWEKGTGVFRDDGLLLFLEGFISDVSARKRAEEELFESRQMLRTILDNVPQRIFWKDRQSVYVGCNKALAEDCGFADPGEIVGKTDYETKSAAVADLYRVDDRTVMETGQSKLNYEELQIKPDGSQAWLRTNKIALRDQTGRVIGMLGTYEDITAMRRAQEALRENEFFLRRTQEVGRIGSYKLDIPTGHWICSPTLDEIFGIAADFTKDIAGWIEIVAPDQRAEMSRYFAEHVVAGHNRFDKEYRTLRVRDRQERWVHGMGELEYDELGAPMRMIGTIQDVTERKQAEIALEQQHRYIEAVLENAPIGFAVNSISDGVAQYVSARFEEIYGVPRGSLRTVDDYFNLVFTDPVYREQIRTRILADMASGDAARMRWENLPITTHTGEKRVVTAINIPLLDQNLMVSTVQDVTERARATEELHRHQHWLEQAERIARVGGWALNLRTGMIWASAEARRIYGFDALGEVPLADIQDVALPEYRPPLAMALRALIERGVPYDIEFRIARRSDGGLADIHSQAEYDPLNGVIFGVIQDITERKQAEAALRESEERFAQFMQYLPGLAYLKDEQRQVLFVNEQFATAFGRPATEWLGQTNDELWPPAVREKMRADDELILRERKPLATIEKVESQGQPHTYRTIKFPIPRPDGKVWLGGITIDITELQQAEEALRRLNDELEQRVRSRTAELEAANNELEAFSYSVSHDLRAPLRAIDGFTRILVEDYAAVLDAEGQRVLGVVSKEGQRMGQLIDDLLTFSRLGRRALQTVDLDLETLAREVFDGLAALVPARQLRLYTTPLPPAHVDPALFRQVLTNLLDNAIKYTRPQAVAEIEIGGSVQGSENVYHVKDNGVGFDMQYADKLFGVFQRLHREDEFEGTGVGLALVQRIVHRHGGRVWAESHVGQGATFFFTLPNRTV